MNMFNLQRPLLFVIAAQMATQLIVSAETDDKYDELCDKNWFPKGGKCFFISKDYATFYKAIEKCESMESVVAQVSSNDDQYLLISVLVDRSKKCEPEENCADFWIGVLDPYSQNKWTTVDSAPIPNVQKYWALGYPQSQGKCVYMSIQSQNQDIKTWKNENCAMSLKYVCTTPQKNRPITTTTTTTTTTTPKPIRYRVINRKMSWSNALSECAKFGSYASLAKISSAKENNEVTIFLNNEIAKNAQNCGDFWIGAHRLEFNCQKPFVWQNQHGQEIPMKYSAWNYPQPDCASGIEKCVHIRKNWNFNWNDDRCDDTLCALCELHGLE